ncbi:glycosyltransferase [Ramlibacter sp. PS4R-6]|uniref:glycosyltransferase n=1 Tax=Ramlibacter sp. PS4R-6 TaxID=3133438 RepID=UPI00309D664E
MTKHVLFVHDNRSVGGVGQVSRQLAQGLQGRGWSVDHLNLSNPGSAFEHLKRVDRMRGVIVATQNFSTSYVACALAAIARRPWVMCVHGPVTNVLEAARPGAVKRALLRYTYRRAPVVVCSSQASLDSLRAFCDIDPSRQRLHVIRNTAAPEFLAAGAPVPGSRRLGFVGRLSAEKQPHVLIETLAVLPPDYGLTVVGTGALAPALVEKGRAEIASGRLQFAGQQAITAASYRQWDVTLLCSAYEGYPLVLLESLASGVPVVSTPIPPAAEMLARHAPYMVARDASPQALAEAVQALFARDPQEVARDIAAVNAEHDPQGFIAAWDDVLTESIAR